MFTIDSVGRSGGLCLFWGEETKVEIINYSHHNINVVICDPITRVMEIHGFLRAAESPKKT